MSQDEFTRLFKYMSNRFDKIDTTLEEKASRADIERSISLLDELANKIGYQLPT